MSVQDTYRRFKKLLVGWLKSLDLFEIIFWIVLAIFIIIKCIYYQFTTTLISGHLLNKTNSYMLLSSFGMLVIIFSLPLLIFNKRRLIALFVIDIILSVLLISDTVYFRYYHNSITVPVLQQIGLIGPLGSSIKNLLKFNDIIYFIDLPFFIAGMIFLFRRGVKKIPLLEKTIAGFVIAILGIIILNSATGNVSSLWFPYDKNDVTTKLGILYFHYYDVKDFMKENVFANKTLSVKDKKDINDFFANKPKTPTNFKGIAKGKNLIIIQMEAIQQFVINKKIDGQEITPNLNALIKESTYFDNFYYQVGEGNTSDAEFLCNTSQYPAKEGAVYFRYPSNTFNSLPKLLKTQGYNTYAFHAYHPSFWNRTVMYKSLGFDTFISDKDYTPGENIGFGLNDTSFFNQSVVKLDKSHPFYGFFITLSSHYAFGPFRSYSNFGVGKYEGTSMGDYLRAANYVDLSIGNFIRDLKKEGLYDNSIIVIYGDHHSFPKGQNGSVYDFLGVEDSEYQWLKTHKVPLIIHCPGVRQGETVKTAGGEIDIFPTVANLLGLEAPYAFGKDLMNNTNGYAVLRDGSFATDTYLYSNETKQAYDINNGNVLSSDIYENDFKKFQNELNISDILLKKNGFKKLTK